MGGTERRVQTHQAVSKSHTLNAKLVKLLRDLQDDGQVRFAPETDDPNSTDLAGQIVENTIDCLENGRVQVLALGSQVHSDRPKMEKDLRAQIGAPEGTPVEPSLKLFRGPDGRVYDFPEGIDAVTLRDNRTIIWKDGATPSNARHAKVIIHELNHVLNPWPASLKQTDRIDQHINDIAANLIFELRAYVMQAMCFEHYGHALPTSREFRQTTFEDYLLSSQVYIYMDHYRSVPPVKRLVDAQIAAPWNQWPGNRTNRRT